jgi:hypothetical protein
MEKLKVGDKVKLKNIVQNWWTPSMHKYKGKVVEVHEIVNDYRFRIKDDISKINPKPTTKSRSKQISQSLKQICTKGLVIKSEDIIAKVKESIGTDYVFGDTILRSLRHLRQDGVLDYTADKHTREYTFR